MRIFFILLTVLIASISCISSVRAQSELTPNLGVYVEWLELEALMGTQSIELPPKAFTVGALVELAPAQAIGFVYRFSVGRGIGIGKPALNLTRFDTSVLYILPFSNIKVFGDGGMGLLQLQSDKGEYWRNIGWLGAGLRVRPTPQLILAFEIKVLGLIQLDIPDAPLPLTWIFRLEGLWGRF